MENDNLKKETGEEELPQIHVNEYGATKDSTVVVEEKDRTVLLTQDETIIIPKEQTIDVPPKNRERKVYAGMWGTTELVTVGLGLLAILTTILVFVFLVIPAQKELDENRARRDELEKQFQTANNRYGTITTTKERVAEIVQSVDDFETRYLPAETNGKAALAQQINGLIGAYGLINTTGPDYAPLEIADQTRSTQASEDGTGKSKFISIFPGQYVTMTVDGTYQNLRRFIREIETSNNFVVISAVELEPSENKEKESGNQTVIAQVNQPQTQNNPTAQNQFGGVGPNTFGQPNQQTTTTVTKIDRGKTRGETVTLRLELAAYFRRPTFQPQATTLER